MAAATSLMFQGLTRMAPEERGHRDGEGGEGKTKQQRRVSCHRHRYENTAGPIPDTQTTSHIKPCQDKTPHQSRPPNQPTPSHSKTSYRPYPAVFRGVCTQTPSHPPAPRLCAAPANSDSTSTPALSA